MLYIGSDHAGFQLKESVKKYLHETGIEFTDLGTHSENSCDYTVIAKELSDKVLEKDNNLGILICGTGVGMSIAANKTKGIRAACCSEPYSAKLTRQHNNANVLCFGGRVIGLGLAFELVDAFIKTPFSGEARHMDRINKISQIENYEG
ncbi:MAG: ribose 5-phosphate isomerase B [Clostridiales bacterium]|jgi:ribose 5-phosphate isomerase B|nr:ribose 5-phosphate isomerase B [Clostridiales bacterium]